MFASKDLFFTKPSGGYQISRSVRLRSSASAYFNRTLTTPTNNKIFTWSAWVKRGVLVDGGAMRLFSANGLDSIFFGSYDATEGYLAIYLNGASSGALVSTSRYRDPSAWYHIVVAFDTTQATASNRIKVYVNGVQVTAFGTATYPSQNYNPAFNSAVGHNLGQFSGSQYFDGYMTEINFIDGQQLTPSSFGQTNTITGVWQPIKYTGTYGTNGFYLNFSDNSAATAAAIGKDYSGNGNNWTPNNISVTAGVTYDSMIDVPTLYADGGNGRGNYCVMNPLNPDTISLNGSLTNGNLNASGTTYGVSVFSCTFQVPQSGKWYWETVYTTITNTVIVGIRSYSTSSTDVRYYSNGNKEVGGSTTAYGSSWTTNDVIGVAVDRDAGTVTFYKNNTSQGSINIPTNSAQFDITFNTTSPFGSTAMSVNFGQRPFSYTPPSGFLALNTQNLPTPTISNGANYMAASTYTANASTQTINNGTNNPAGITFQPDFVWTKSRTGAYSHEVFDVIRGVNAYLGTNNTAAEVVGTAQLTSFNSNGFTLGANENSNFTNGYAAVAWNWKANGAGVSNTSGSITSTVSANPTAGFSIVTWAGSGAAGTIGHGLNAVPAMLITKKRTSATNSNWVVWQKNLTGGNTITDAYYMYLNGTNGQNQSGGVFYKGTDITSTTFGFQGGNDNVNASGQNYVAYCFAEVAGYSKFGSYTGNGSADGPFVYLGFRPRWVMIKRTDSTGNWQIIDTSRSPYNEAVATLYPNLSNAEDLTNTKLDALSNGFKIRGTPSTDFNTNGSTYIYAAFAENPFKNSLAR